MKVVSNLAGYYGFNGVEVEFDLDANRNGVRIIALLYVGPDGKPTRDLALISSEDTTVSWDEIEKSDQAIRVAQVDLANKIIESAELAAKMTKK